MKLTPLLLCVCGCLTSIACGGTKIITIKHTNLDGNSEYWVCEGHSAKKCAGERDGQIDPAGYQARVEVHAPPKECVNGAANMEVVLDGSDVTRVRYECAQPPLPAGGGGAGGGLPPSAGLPASAGSAAAPPPGPGTGLPGGAP
jgi:hypothetical protein